jgi:putative serine protease PepD
VPGSSGATAASAGAPLTAPPARPAPVVAPPPLRGVTTWASPPPGAPGTFTRPEDPQPEGYQPVDAVPPAAWNADLDTKPGRTDVLPTAPYEKRPLRPRRRRRGSVGLAATAVVCLLAGAVGGVAAVSLLGQDDLGGRQTVNLPQAPAADLNRPPGSVAGVAQAILPTVVAIKVRGSSSDEGGTGSGFVIDSAKGYILTNNHVVTAGGSEPANRIDVQFQDGTQARGELVGRDDSYDLAVVRVNVQGLRAVRLGNSDGVVVGDPVIAIGAPLGLRGTVTTGIVSALNRPVSAGEGDAPAFINAIQTDAAINPGNSGGPLVDSKGRVIGINSAIARIPGQTTASSGSIGLGFAIPSNQAKRTAEELIATGKAEHPIIGVVLDREYEGVGVQVSNRKENDQVPVTPGGPADKAGIRAGDIITRFNDRPVTEPDELIVAIRAQQPGDTVRLTVRRGSSERVVGVVLDASAE